MLILKCPSPDLNSTFHSSFRDVRSFHTWFHKLQSKDLHIRSQIIHTFHRVQPFHNIHVHVQSSHKVRIQFFHNIHVDSRHVRSSSQQGILVWCGYRRWNPDQQPTKQQGELERTWQDLLDCSRLF